MTQSWKLLRQRCADKLEEYRFLLKPFIILSVVYLFAISAILRANVYYIDDLGRARMGYAFWENYARHLSVFFSHILHADEYLTDVSPLTQIIAVFLMALASVLAIYILSDNKKMSFWSLVAIIPLGLNPYLLECFSYKYDSPYMAFSVLAAIFPLLFYKGNWKTYSIVSVLSILCMCMTYQVSTGIYPMLVVLVCIRRWISGDEIKEILKFAVVSAVSYVIGILAFNKFFIVEEYTDFPTDIVTLDQLIPNAIGHYKSYVKLFLQDFKVEWLILIAVICAAFLYVTIRHTKQYRILTAILAVPALAGLFALSFGVYPFLVKPGFEPRCMYGIGCFIAFLGVYVVSAAPKVYPAKLACLVLSWAFFVFAFTYGNALDAQSTYTDFRLEQAVEDLVDSGVLATEGTKSVRITGTIGHSLVIRNMPQDYQILNRMVPVNFSDSQWWWGSFKLLHYYGFTNLEHNGTDDLSTMDLPLIADNVYHTIRANEEYIWIDLHQ